MWVLCTFPCSSVVHIPMFECCPHSHVWVLYTFPCAGARESAFRNIKTIAECLADELINAAKVPCKFTIIDVKPPLCAILYQCAAHSCRGGMVGANHYSEHNNHYLTMNVSRTVAFLGNFTIVLGWCCAGSMVTSVTVQAGAHNRERT